MMQWPRKECLTPLWTTEGIIWGKQPTKPTVVLTWHPSITTEYNLRLFMPSYFEFV